MRTQHFMGDSVLAETDGAATPARGVVQRSKYPREHPGSRFGEGIACKVLQGMYAPACARLRGRFASGCAARGRQGEPFHATHVHPVCICTCAVCVHLRARIATQASPFSRPPATHFMSACHQIHLPSCRSVLLQAFSTEIAAAFVVAAGDTVAGWPSFSGADVGIA